MKRLLHVAVSDVDNDVRRAAVEALGFLLFRSPDQIPSMVSLLSESYNPHVRYGAAMALGVACAGLGQKEALGLLEPLTNDLGCLNVVSHQFSSDAARTLMELVVSGSS